MSLINNYECLAKTKTLVNTINNDKYAVSILFM